MALGNTKDAEEAEWQKNKGQFFLHEMMHLDAVGNPDIKAGTASAQPRRRTRGAARASTNADSYAWLANSLYFYDATGYFPRPPKYRKIAEIDNISPANESRAQDIFPVYLGEFKGEVKDEEVTKRFQADIKGLEFTPPTQTDSCKSDNGCSSPACTGVGAVYSCVEGTCQCGSQKPPPAPLSPPPAGLQVR
ncbi:hypothetical protein CkaCkLH20_04179 [Colletotrichum karsti]|uniref:Lysine-specific metallo-endopeptidase domain-containing protein n=1 Tax=Colletotrichum karsti TaxID=1095194 RepID=A0A9P6IAE6_9PEZI|nr:uncharacterized protein CkaCkLH20_04179 [Colletotrichum karsti]KAF9878141.1 hypothetical protein CkaCkLH20_04179 [Colletotrichum karsti]